MTSSIEVLSLVMNAVRQPCCLRFKTTDLIMALWFEKFFTKRLIRLFRKNFKFVGPILTERADINNRIEQTFPEEIVPLIKINLERKWIEAGFTSSEASWIEFLTGQLIEKWTKHYRMEASVVLGAHILTRLIAFAMHVSILLIVLKICLTKY